MLLPRPWRSCLDLAKAVRRQQPEQGVQVVGVPVVIYRRRHDVRSIARIGRLFDRHDPQLARERDDLGVKPSNCSLLNAHPPVCRCFPWPRYYAERRWIGLPSEWLRPADASFSLAKAANDIFQADMDARGQGKPSSLLLPTSGGLQSVEPAGFNRHLLDHFSPDA